MPTLTLIDASDLNSWSNRNDAAAQLPQLLRKLITGTVSAIRYISFRSGDGVAIGGWDGRLETHTGNAFAPDGQSVWELGTGKVIKGKADDDYEKRKSDPLGYAPSETTFVFVTSRQWGGKDDWVAAHKAEGFWKDVRAYDADDLATWLETNPGVHVWLSIRLGKHPEAAVDISHFWAEWSGVTIPPLTPELVVCRRYDVVDRIHAFLREPPSVLAVQAESRDEALAFFASALNLLPENELEHYANRCVVAENLVAWRHLSASSTPLVLVADFSEKDRVGNALQRGHHVLIPLGKGDPAAAQTVKIPRLHRADLKEKLVALGLQNDQADSLATLGRRSLLALRRQLARTPEVHCPLWGSPSEARAVLPILLAGKWVDSNQADQEVMSRLAGVPYEQLSETIARWANESDSPVRKVGDTFFLVSKEDAWSLISRFITREDLDNFENAFLDVFGTVDPSLGLSPDVRWQANILGKVMPYSTYLREGLAETLAIMGARSETTSWLDSSTGHERANRIIWKLFERANKDWKIWSSLAYQLPLFAEASPERFLDAVDQGLTGDSPPVMNLFVESGDGFLGSGSQHSSLLWALEMLAWQPDYLGQTALILAKLAKLDPGGKLANRPHASLRGIFLGWYPQTNASLDKRLGVIDAIRRREPVVAWNLMVGLLPEMHGIAHPTHKPNWREWNIPSEPSVKPAEIWRLTEEIVNRLLEDVGFTRERWGALLAALGRVPKTQHDAIVKALNGLDAEQFTIEDKRYIWKTLREIVSRHRDFSEADWALPSEVIDELEVTYNKFTPEDPVDQYAWLFSYSVDLLNPPPNYQDWQLREEIVNGLREEALAKLNNENGVEMLLKLAEQAEEPILAGFAVGKNDLVNKDEEIEILNKYLVSENTNRNRFAIGFASGRFDKAGWSWAEETIRSSDWSPEQRANFLSCLPFDEQTWNLLESIGDRETEDSYWSRINPRYGKQQNFELVVRKLLEYHRPQFAVDFLAHYTYNKEVVIPPALALDVLENLISVTADKKISWGNIGHDLTRLMKVVRSSNEIDEARIAQLEFLIFPLLENYGDGPKILHRDLARDPELFVELVRIIFRAEDDETGEQSASPEHINLAFQLLNSWHLCPGLREDGTLDGDLLRAWVMKAHNELHELRRGVIGDQQIGQALAESPCGTDGIRPHEFVREIIEQLSNFEIERGYEVRVFNNRGVTMRNPTDGGGQERTLAAKYLEDAEKISDNSPRTAAMLRRIAESYLRHARREDISAELMEDLWR